MAKESFNVVSIVNQDGCFDLQFRKDTRHDRTGAPTYYRWKAQFVVTAPKADKKILDKIQKTFACGSVTISRSQARYAVQKIEDICEIIVPYFRKNSLADKKKKDFDLWIKAVEIIGRNKGKPLTGWKKAEINQLMQIHASCLKYKSRPRAAKWLGQLQSYTSPTAI